LDLPRTSVQHSSSEQPWCPANIPIHPRDLQADQHDTAGSDFCLHPFLWSRSAFRSVVSSFFPPPETPRPELPQRWPTLSIQRCKQTRPAASPWTALLTIRGVLRHSDLLRRLNPKHTTDHLNAIISLAPDLQEDLLSSVDQPLSVRRCQQTGRDYLLCDYNRDGDSYRSPWSNEFDPPLEPTGRGAGDDEEGGGALPSERVRKIEIAANEAFDVYREMYYEGGISSVYLWNLDDGFAGVVLLKKGNVPISSLALRYQPPPPRRTF
jgi:hypothetical protein